MNPVKVSAPHELSRQTARNFADKWAAVKSEKQFAQSFWSDFFGNLIGIQDLMATGIEFEYPIKSVKTGQTNFIDVLWKGIVLIEHKSAGKSLDVAEVQARDYLESLPISQRPPILFISDFAHLRIINVALNHAITFDLLDLPDHLNNLEAVFGKYAHGATEAEVTADQKAVRLMADLYKTFEENGYEGHAVSVMLIRTLFLMFGDDTRMWKRKGLFEELLENSNESGQGLGGTLQELFQALDTEESKRPGSLPANIRAFPHVNGGLFKETLPIFSFNAQMRAALLEASKYGWGEISPAIFGAMFQTIKSKEDRRALGEHYTSLTNILKVIRPLFLDAYLSELRRVWDDRNGLRKLQKELGSKHYLDPAAGSGNFLVVTYQRLREIEHKIIARLIDLEGRLTVGVSGEYELQVGLQADLGLNVRLEQFHAIEYAEWSSQIASVAMYITDHQLNLQLEELTGAATNRFPLTHSADILHGNALRLDWSSIMPMDDNAIIMGNPPFGGTDLSDDQRDDQMQLWGKVTGAGEVDYVANWFLLAARHLRGTRGRAAFVASNSITQGQQPPVIWGALTPMGCSIDFAHRSFAWSNDARGKAGVHCVIIGISYLKKPAMRPLWVYETVQSDPELVRVRNINAYLLDAPNVLVTTRRTPLNPETQKVIYGSKPTDKGWLSNITPDVADVIRKIDPIAAKYLRRIVGAEELISGKERWCLWLKGSDPNDRLKSPVIKQRVSEVRKLREASTKPKTVEDAKRAWEFQETRQPTSDYLVVPLHTSQNRDYVPMPLNSPDIIATNAVSFIPNCDLTTFGYMMSSAFNIWTKAVSGRIKSDPRISNTITYNNFPFHHSEPAQIAAIEKGSKAVLDARAMYPTSSLAVLYNREVMPTELRAAHKVLDRAVLNAFGLKANATDVAILERLFERYRDITQGLLLAAPVKKQRGVIPPV